VLNLVRIFVALLVLVGMSYQAHADVVDLLKGGLDARRRGDPDAAIKFFTEAISTGNLSDTDLAFVLGSRGVTFDMKGETDKAIEDFTEAIRLNAEYGSAYIYRGLAWVKKRDYGQAISDFTEAITLDPNSAFIAFNDRANVYELLGENDKAIGDYGQAIQRNPGYATAYFNRAGLRLIRGEYGDAIDDYDHAILLRPNYAEAYRNRADVYQMKGEIDQAIADYGFAVRFNPYDAIAYADRGVAYATRGEFDLAVTDLNSAIALKPGVARFHFKRAVSRLYIGQLDGAVADLNTVVQLDPSSIFAAIWLHVAHSRAAVDDILEMKQKATALNGSQWPAVLLQLFSGGATQEAVTAVGLAVEDEKARSERKCLIAFYLGVFSIEKGDRAAGRDRLQAARASCPTTVIELAAAKAELLRLQSR
jgi:tetratricopeptide (TPR) repeat protein